LFTTIELITSPTGMNQSVIMPVANTPQYLGDLEDNSPLPFSIPLTIGDSGGSTIGAGNYPVSLRITYSDELRNTHEVILNNTVSYNPPPQQEEAPNQGFLGFGSTTADESTTSSSLPLLPIIVAAIAAAAFVIIIVRRRRSRRKKITRLMSGQNDSDEDDFDESLDENLGPSQNNEPSRKE
jgi:phosphotransferase system  glucose/maltose/N-acetylglucosamine-specific IIC component